MSDIELLKREVKVLSFDQYGTIVDMQRGLRDAAAPYLKKKGWDGDPNRFVTWWRRTHFENSMIDSLCDRGHTPYREIGHRAVSYTLTRAGVDHTS
ncbi:MAG: haloacid dehalogenase type II, partial [Pseudomonadota bacterium]